VPRLSIVIPYLGGVGRLEDTLVSVLENRPADCQILVVLGQPYADPYSLAGEICFLKAPAEAGLMECIALGIDASRAAIVHVLGCGVEATCGWVEAALGHFADPHVAAVAPLVVDRFDQRKILSAGLTYTLGGGVRRIAAGPILQRLVQDPAALCGADLLASFYRRSAVQAVLPWLDRAADCLLGADWALALRHAGYRSVLEPNCLVAANHDALNAGRSFGAGRARERLFWRWAPTRGWIRSLAGHALLLGRECVHCLVRPTLTCRLAGRVWASLEIPAHRRHWRRIARPVVPPAAVIGPPHFLTRNCQHWTVEARKLEEQG
jgi:hypothetical protein